MRNDWTDILKSKMESHTQAPPEGLWEDLAASLGELGIPADKPLVSARKTPVLAWLAPVAAAAALAALLIFPHGADAPSVQHVPSGVTAQTPAAEPQPSSELLDGAAGLLADATSGLQAHAAAPQSAPSLQPSAGLLADVASGVQAHAAAPQDFPSLQPPAGDSQGAAEEAPGDSILEDQPVHSAPADVLPLEPAFSEWEDFAPAAQQGRGLDLLFLVNGASAGESSPLVASAREYEIAATPLCKSVSSDAFGLFDEDFYVPEHHYRWSVSSKVELLARYRFTDRWDVSAGLNLTSLDGHSEYDLHRATARLAGVPVYVGYNALNFKNMSLGITAGAGAYKPLSTPSGDRTALLSPSAAVRMEWRLTRLVALQAKAGLDTYLPLGQTDLMPAWTTIAGFSAGLVWNIR